MGILNFFLNFLKKSKGFEEEEAIEFIENIIKSKYPFVNKKAIELIIEIEWEYQSNNAPRKNGAFVLIPRDDPKLKEYLNKKCLGKFSITPELIEDILEALERYEEQM